MLKICVLVAALLAVNVGWAQYSISFENANFEANVQNFPDGFDAEPDVPGWMDWGTPNDCGTEGSGAWWGTYQGMSAFLSQTDAAYILSDRIISEDDSFEVALAAKTWDAASQFTITLFYDYPTNVISTFSNDVTGTWSIYNSPTNYFASDVPESIGGQLGILIENTGAGFVNFDNLEVVTYGTVPFLFDNFAPNTTGIANDVVISADIIDFGSTLTDATLYLAGPGGTNEISSSMNKVVATNTITSSPLTLLASSDYTAILVVEGPDAVLQTNSWSFSMAGRFVLTVSPAAVATDYDFQPTISARIVNVNDAVDYAELYIDGSYVSLELGGAETTTVSYTTGTLTPGENITAEVIVYTLGDYDNLTNTWSVVMGGDVGVTVWNSTPPPLGAFDIAQTGGAISDLTNVGGLEDNALGHEWTYISDNDRPAQGQTFTTPAGVAYSVDSVWLRNTSYDDGGANLSTAGNTYTVRITNPAMTDTAQFVRSQQVLTQVNAGTANAGQWIQFKLAEPVVLNANQVYGFDVGSTGGYYWNTDGSNTDPYAGGKAYRSGDNGDGNLAAEQNNPGDRAFIVQLAEAGEPFSIEFTSPLGPGARNPTQLQVDFTELSGTFDPANTKLLVDGVEQIVHPATGSSPNLTITADLIDQAPLTTHTGMVVLASSSPVTTLTNSWVFTMADAFAFSGYEPAADGIILENNTALSVQVISAADYFFGATMHIDGGADLGPAITTSGSTSTVSVVSTGPLDVGLHEAKVIVQGAFGVVTKTWEFKVKETTDDSVWNINIAGNLGGTSRNVTQGTIAVAPASGSNLWNNVRGNDAPTGHTNSVFVTDSNAENPIGFIITGIGYYGEATDDGQTVELTQGWFGGTDAGNPPNADFAVSVTGLSSSASYDLYIYDTWRWAANGEQAFEIVEGYVWDNPSIQSSGNVRANVQNDGPQDYSGFVDGENYALFTRVTPANGVITFTAGNDQDRVVSGLQIREHPGQGDVPDVEYVSVAPEGTAAQGAVDLEVVMVDLGSAVVTEDVILLLDGEAVLPDSISKIATTTTVSYAGSRLELGLHTAAIVPVPGSRTNEWTFFTVSDDGRIIYVDADPANTTAWNGSAYSAYNPPVSGEYGNDNQWEIEVFANDATWYEAARSSEGADENAPQLKTTVTGLPYSTYAVYAYGWTAGDGNSPDWNLAASLTPTYTSGLPIYDINSDIVYKPAQSAFSAPQPIVTEGNRAMFAVYLGTVSGTRIDVYIDDANGNSAAAEEGFWYDGIGYLDVTPPVIIKSVSPEGETEDDTPVIEVVLEDGAVTVNPDNVVLLVDGSPVTPDSITRVGATTTVSYVSLPLSLGEHTAGIVPARWAATNEWTFAVKPPAVSTAYGLWNVNFAGISGGTLRPVTDGSIVRAPSTGSDLWNNLAGLNGATNTFGITDSNGGNQLTLVTSGPHNWGESIDNDITVELFQGWAGANANADYDAVLSGLSTDATYDLYVYSTWRWTENDTAYHLTQGSSVIMDAVVSHNQAAIQGDGATSYADLVEGENYYVFTEITPSAAGTIALHVGDDVDTVCNGFQLVARTPLIPPPDGPELSLSIADGGPFTITWPTSFGDAFNVLTNDDLVNSGGWGVAVLPPYVMGDNYVITNEIPSEGNLFIKLESN